MASASYDHPLLRRLKQFPFLLYGILFVTLGCGMYCLGNLISVPRLLFGLQELLPLNQWIVWYSGIPFMLGIAFCVLDLCILLPLRRRVHRPQLPVPGSGMTVALTAYNDEESIGPAVEDFLTHPKVRRVIVVSNNSTDATMANAQAAGAITFNEPEQGYGRCVYRCLQEAMRYDDTEMIMLSEGDGTFVAGDIDKFLAYLPHAGLVNGTRIVEQLRGYDTQLSTFMFFGNFFVAKLLEAKHAGKVTLTDVGTTYKLCRRDVLERLLPELNPAINLAFNAHFLDTALRTGETLLECPITFHKRVGVSKGGNVNNRRALCVGLEMIKGIVYGWPGKHAG